MPSERFRMPPEIMPRLSLDTTYKPTKAGQMFKYKHGHKVYFKIERPDGDEWIPMQGAGKPRRAKLKEIMDAFKDGEALFDPSPYASRGTTSLVAH